MKVMRETAVDVPLRNWNEVQRAVQRRSVPVPEVTEVNTPADVSGLVKMLSSEPLPFVVLLVRSR